jgi:DNA-binding MarR family transcriptional regulator
MAAVLAEEGCSVEQWRVLSIIADGRGHPMTEIADDALMPAPSLTKLVDRMVADNLVYRRPDPADRRRVLLHLTARGRSLHRRAAGRVHADQVTLLEAIGDDGALMVLLARLHAAADGQPVAVRVEQRN